MPRRRAFENRRMAVLPQAGLGNGLAGRLALGRQALRTWRTDRSDHAGAQRAASGAFLIRVASAAIAFLSQPLLARWLGTHEFGIYAYVWSCLTLVGGIIDSALPPARNGSSPNTPNENRSRCCVDSSQEAGGSPSRPRPLSPLSRPSPSHCCKDGSIAPWWCRCIWAAQRSPSWRLPSCRTASRARSNGSGSRCCRSISCAPSRSWC